MRLGDLLLVYALGGVACAVAVVRAELAAARAKGAGEGRARAVTRAWIEGVITLAVWPIWAPLVLTKPREGAIAAPKRSPGEGSVAPADPRVTRAAEALSDAAASSVGTPFEQLFTAEAAQRIGAELARAAARLAEIDAMLADERCGVAAAEARLASLAAAGGSERSFATARLQLESARRLAAVRERDARAIDELGELAQALRAQLALARFAGPDGGRAGDIVAEVWARIEGLSAASDDCDAAHAPAPIDADRARARDAIEAEDRGASA